MLSVLLYEALSEYTGKAMSWGILTGVRPVKVLAKYSDEDAREKLLVSNEKLALSRTIDSIQQPLIKQIPKNSYSLYVSIPFCPTRCAYCSFVSYATPRYLATLPTYLDKLCDSCYVCDRINEKISKMFVTAVYLWETEKQFRQYLREQPYICYDHYRTFLRYAQRHLSKKLYPDFLTDINELQTKYLEKLSGDVSWFCKKFDYRYDEEPWGDAKDAVERAISFLSGESWKNK